MVVSREENDGVFCGESNFSKTISCAFKVNLAEIRFLSEGVCAGAFEGAYFEDIGRLEGDVVNTIPLDVLLSGLKDK